MKFTTRFEKWLAIVVSMALLITCLAVPMVVSAEGEGTITVWDGKTITKPAGYDDAEPTDPILITNAAELAYVVSNGTEKGYAQQYKLTADIYLNDVTVPGWKDLTTNNAWYRDNSVCGVFDGDGHTVYGLWYPSTTTGNIGLFPVANSRLTIKNLAVKEAQVDTTSGAAGAFVGIAKTGNFSSLTVDNCYSDGTVTVNSFNKTGAGGILGQAFGKGATWTFSNTYSFAIAWDGTWSGATANYDKFGAIVGDYWTDSSNTDMDEMTMTNCYGIYKLISVSKGVQVDFENCYCRSDASAFNPPQYPMLSAADMQGAVSLANMGGLGDKYVSTSTYPALVTFADPADSYFNFGEVAVTGKGTEPDPYLISNAKALEWAVASFGLNGKHFKLTNNIIVNSRVDINIVDGTWRNRTGKAKIEWFAGATSADNYVGYAGATGTFKGTLDGDGYFVSGIYLSTDAAKNGGLIPVLENGAVKNLGIKNSYIKAATNNGAFAGVASLAAGTKAEIIGCYVDESVTVSNAVYSGASVGAFIGYASYNREVAITDSWANANLVGNGIKLGGLIGSHASTTITVKDTYSASRWYKSASDLNNGTVAAWTGTSAIINVAPTASKTTLENVLSTAALSIDCKTGTYAKDAVDMIGAAGLANLEAAGFDTSKYYAVEGKTPRFIIAGTTSGDVDKDGLAIGDFENGGWYTDTRDGDVIALSNYLIGKGGDITTANFNRDSNVDICDLVGLAMNEKLF